MQGRIRTGSRFLSLAAFGSSISINVFRTCSHGAREPSSTSIFPTNELPAPDNLTSCSNAYPRPDAISVPCLPRSTGAQTKYFQVQLNLDNPQSYLVNHKVVTCPISSRTALTTSTSTSPLRLPLLLLLRRHAPRNSLLAQNFGCCHKPVSVSLLPSMPPFLVLSPLSSLPAGTLNQLRTTIKE